MLFMVRKERKRKAVLCGLKFFLCELCGEKVRSYFVESWENLRYSL